jgi:hypothetical protein
MQFLKTVSQQLLPRALSLTYAAATRIVAKQGQYSQIGYVNQHGLSRKVSVQVMIWRLHLLITTFGNSISLML